MDRPKPESYQAPSHHTKVRSYCCSRAIFWYGSIIDGRSCELPSEPELPNSSSPESETAVLALVGCLPSVSPKRPNILVVSVQRKMQASADWLGICLIDSTWYSGGYDSEVGVLLSKDWAASRVRQSRYTERGYRDKLRSRQGGGSECGKGWRNCEKIRFGKGRRMA